MGVVGKYENEANKSEQKCLSKESISRVELGNESAVEDPHFRRSIAGSIFRLGSPVSLTN